MAEEAGEEEEEPEPMLKYQRLGASVTAILAADTAACLAAHSRFLALGTDAGSVHVLDLNGNEIRHFTPHSARVHCVSVDSTGEFVGSCSQDGTVVISSLYGADASTHWYAKPVTSFAFDPDYATKRIFATGGMAGQLVINSKGWFGAKDTVVHSGEGPVMALACTGPMLAWQNDLGVKVYDALACKRVSFIEKPASAATARPYRCHLQWNSATELLIGWCDTIKIGRVKTRDMSATPLTAASARAAGSSRNVKYMEIVALIQTDFYVCGLCAVQLRHDGGQPIDDLLVLAYYDSEEGAAGEPKNVPAERPELRLISRQNDEIFSDALSMEGYEKLSCDQYSLALLSSPEGATAVPAPTSAAPAAAAATAASELCVYILSPRDIVVASARDADDKLAWLIARGKLERAVDLAVEEQPMLTQHRLVDVVELYVDQLVQEGLENPSFRHQLHDRAAQLCARHFGEDVDVWVRWLGAFCRAGGLEELAPHVPLRSPQLPCEAYEAAICSCLDGSNPMLLSLLRRWPPSVYRGARIKEAILQTAIERPGGLKGQPHLIQAMALLHCQAAELHDALGLMLMLPRGTTELFRFIEDHGLHAACRERIAELVNHDWTATLALLVEHVDALPVETVVPQLDGEDVAQQRRLHEYLHALFTLDGHVGAAFHERQLQLYADLAPELLLPFLRASAHYSLQEALRISEQHDLLEARVFILGRMGRNEDALALMLKQMHDLPGAIEFVQAANDIQLWQSLVAHSMQSVELIDSLLDHVCRAPLMQLDQVQLVRQLPEGVSIPRLRERLAAFIEQASNELDLTRACLQVAQADYLGLVQRRHHYLRAGTVAQV